MIEIIEGRPPADELPIIEVISYPSPMNESVTISCVSTREQEGMSVVFKDIVNKEKIPFDEALEIAKKLALEVGWNRIYAENKS